MSNSSTRTISTYDPRKDAAFSPYVWLPLTFLLISCLLFVSLRRAHALRLYDRFLTWSHQNYPFLSSYLFPNHSSIQLPTHTNHTHRSSLNNRRTHLVNSDDDANSDSEESDTASDSDELPTSYPNTSFSKPKTFITTSNKLWNDIVDRSKQLGGGGFASTRAVGSTSSSWTDRNSDGIGRMFWGIPKRDRSRGVRLGQTNERDGEHSFEEDAVEI